MILNLKQQQQQQQQQQQRDDKKDNEGEKRRAPSPTPPPPQGEEQLIYACDCGSDGKDSGERHPLIRILPPVVSDEYNKHSKGATGNNNNNIPYPQSIPLYCYHYYHQHPHYGSIYYDYSPQQQKYQDEKAHNQSRWTTLTICVMLLIMALLSWPFVMQSSLSSSNPNQNSQHSRFYREGSRQDYLSSKGAGYTVSGPCSTMDSSFSYGLFEIFRLRSGPNRNKRDCINDSSASQTEPPPPPLKQQQSQDSSSEPPPQQQQKQVKSSSLSSSSYSVSPRRTIPRVESKRGFASYLDFVGGSGTSSIQVTYDAHGILLNGQPTLLLGGSLHPTRAASREEWETVLLDEAVHNGLNLVTLYVFWSAHQPFADQPLDWSLPYARSISNHKTGNDDSWNLAQAIQACADRGLFVHLRLGPYTCAEYSYGGIPEWIGVRYPDIQMRRMHPTWLQLMEGFIQNATQYITQHNLWAHQGGPVLLAQIENELGDEQDEFIMATAEAAATTQQVASSSHDKTTDEIQQYSDWCGEMIQRVAPKQVVWTMCNGLSANNTIETYNGQWEAIPWLRRHGDNGRIQVDQPAMWTEHEQGFQIWGETPDRPVDYFWGTKASDVAMAALLWFARGALHMNYYMWFGGYNRGRSAAAGIQNAYATDAVLCPSGERRQPKFGHLQAMHHMLATIAPLLTATWPPPPPQSVEIQKADNDNGQEWIVGPDQAAFVYTADATSSSNSNSPVEVIFLENTGSDSVMARVSSAFSGDDSGYLTVQVKPYSVIVLVDGNVAFGTATISPEAIALRREKLNNVVLLLDWNSWTEPSITVSTCHEGKGISSNGAPIEQTRIFHNDDDAESQANGNSKWSDYAWYSTRFTLNESITNVTINVDTERAVGMLFYVDGKYCGSAENHEHKEGSITFQVPAHISLDKDRHHDLTILSESFGYYNLIGRWGGGRVGPKPKGITGNVTIVSGSNDQVASAYSLTLESSDWCSLGGLKGEQLGLPRPDMHREESLWGHLDRNPFRADGPLWKLAYFDSPLFGADQHLFLEITGGAARGHIWVNGHDLGRYWTLLRSSSPNNVGDDDTLEGDEWEQAGDDDDDDDDDDNDDRPVEYSQRYYHVPKDFLTDGSSLNELVLLNVYGQGYRGGDVQVQLVLSWVETSSYGNGFQDLVGFPDSCLV